MCRYILSVLVLLLTCVQSFGNVEIPKKYWEPNKPGGYCCYTSITTVGRFYGIKKITDFEVDGKRYNVASWYEQWQSRGASDEDVRSCLDNLGVNYVITNNATIEWLKQQTDAGVPVIIAIHWSVGEHAIVITDVRDGWVQYIDPNDVSKYNWINQSWFERNWWKWALIIKR